MNQPIGPATKRLLEAMEELADGIDPTRAADRLEHAGRGLVEAAEKMRSRSPESAFNHLTPEDVKTLMNLLQAHLIAIELASEARAMDAEDN